MGDVGCTDDHLIGFTKLFSNVGGLLEDESGLRICTGFTARCSKFSSLQLGQNS